MSTGRYPEEFIRHVLSMTTLTELVSEHVQVKKSGATISGRCPFHEEKSPSFSVKGDTFRCFGCGEHGNAIDFVRSHLKLSFPEAVKYLAQRAGIPVPERATEFQDTKPLYDALGFAHRKFVSALANSPQAQQYLATRGVPPAQIERFSLGYAPNHYSYISGPTSSQWLEPALTTGLIKLNDEKQQHYDFFVDRIMFPIRGKQGGLLGYTARYIGQKSNPAKYLNSPDSPLFHKHDLLYGLYELREKYPEPASVVVVEGPLDVIALDTTDIPALAAMGTSVTAQHIQALMKLTQDIVFLMDGDKAGHASKLRTLYACLPYLADTVSIRFATLPDGEDPDSMIKQGRNAELTTLIQHATCISDLLIEVVTEETRSQSALTSKSAFCHKIKSHLDAIPDTFFKELLILKISRIICIENTVIRRLFSPSGAQSTIP